MSVSTILGGFANIQQLAFAKDEDWVDRLNHLYTVGLLALFALFVTGGQYVGSPIECLKPDRFDGEMDYVKTYCWVKNTYYVSFDAATIPAEEHKRREQELTYYQWVPQILVFMAFMFKLPSVIWRLLNNGSGINMDKMVTMTMETQMGDARCREETVEMLAKYLDRWLEAHRYYRYTKLSRLRQRLNQVVCLFCSKQDGTYLISLYFFVKILYLVNVIVQFILINRFMGGWFSSVGYDVVESFDRDRDFSESRVFPRTTFCDFKVRQQGFNTIQFTTQCVLPINLFNEKIFVFLWYWAILVLVCTSGNFLFWAWDFLFRRHHVSYVRKYLRMSVELRGEEERRVLKEFTAKYLKDDGVFVLRIIARNTNDILLADIVTQLWQIYRDKRSKRRGSGVTSEVRGHDVRVDT